jgi:hypothetical protein
MSSRKLSKSSIKSNLKDSRFWDQSTVNGLLVQYLVIAGGGGGGTGIYSNARGGGGGAGGYRCSVIGEKSGGLSNAESPLLLTTGTSYTVQVGTGGQGGLSTGSDDQFKILATRGSDSVFSTITSTGGGPGGEYWMHPTAITSHSGGSGGGGGTSENSGGNFHLAGTGVSGQGFAGGDGVGYNGSNSAAGGGGAGSVGQSSASTGSTGGNGGLGIVSSITGFAIARAGGGGGGGTSGFGIGNSGGGNGAVAAPGQSGTPNTGGGGGGGGDTGGLVSTGWSGGDGGSGVIILKYPSSYSIVSSGSLVLNTDSTTVTGFKITTFVSGNGSISFS